MRGRLGHVCGGGHAEEPLALGQRQRAEADAGLVQEVVGKTASRGAAAGHQEFPPTVCPSVFVHRSRKKVLMGPLENFPLSFAI